MDHLRIVWSDALRIGDPAIDGQHQALISLISQVDERQTPRDATTLVAALAYAQTHFRDEEQLMRTAGYPELAAHAQEHKRLTRTLVAYEKDFAAGKTDLYAFKQFMFTWVRDHIMEEDVKLGRWLAGRRNA